ncbi:MAG: type II CAAX endopeptidase family protein [Archangium sp.]
MNEPVITDVPAEPAKPPLAFFVAWFGVGLVVYLLLGGATQFLHLTFGLWFSEIAIFVGMTVLGWQLLSTMPARAIGVAKFEPKSFAIGVAFGLVNYVAWAVPTMAAAHAIFPKKIIEIFDGAKIFDRQTPLELWLIVLGVSIAAPFGEEFFFRGFFQRGLELHRGGPRAVVLTAFIFSAFHLDPVGLVSRFELGVLFGLLAWYSGSLWPAMGAHAANNAFSSILFLASRGEDTPADEDSIKWYVALGMFVVGNAVLIALVRMTAPHLKSPVPAEIVDQPRPTFLKAASPWVLGGLASIALLAALDWRGVALNALDGVSQLPAATLKRPELKELRARVRSGDAQLSEYRDRLKTVQTNL